MLKKLLHYDLKSVFKYWWIAALASIGLSVAGGFALSIPMSDQDVHPLIAIVIVFTIIFAFIGIVAFPIFSYIMLYVRFYKNFFTDEGYLTFTLPVKRSQLLNSKLITSVLIMFCSAAVVFFDITFLLALAAGKSFHSDLLTPLSQELSRLFTLMSGLDYLYLCIAFIEVLLIIVLLTALSTLFIFACITFGAIITKKAKVITAIGVYYVSNGVITGFMQLVYLFGITALADKLSYLPENITNTAIIIVLLAVVMLIALICMLLYALNYFMIDRKLNLA